VIFHVSRERLHGDPTSELNKEKRRRSRPVSDERKFRSSLASL
jgi:hypothetical protein